MGYYGLDHPNPNKPQLAYPRRAEPSGVVHIHTTEGVLDAIAPDTGAENTAHYITIRTDYGSYHTIVDSDSVVRFAPPDYETWHVAVDNFNWHSFGVSFACRATDWGGPTKKALTAWDIKALKLAAKEIANYARWWASLAPGRNPLSVARHITPDQARAKVPGMIGHGESQPADRSDPFGGNPLEPVLWSTLVDLVRAELSPVTPPKEWDEMASKDEIRQVVQEVVQKELGGVNARLNALKAEVEESQAAIKEIKKATDAELLGKVPPNTGGAMRGWLHAVWLRTAPDE